MSAFTDDLYRAFGIGNPLALTRRYHCPLIRYSNNGGPHVTVTFLRDGRWREAELVYVPQHTAQATRRIHLDKARKWAAERLGVPEDGWSTAGYPGVLIPADVRKRVAEDVERWRADRRARLDAELSA